MSLSNHLRDASSPVRIYMDRMSPVLAGIQEYTSTSSASAGELGFAKLAASTPIVPVPPGIDTARMGTAFDIRTRIALGSFDVQTSSAKAGVDQLLFLSGQVQNGQHRTNIISEAFAIAEALLEKPSSNIDQNLASIVLAHGEQIYRAGAAVLNGALGVACDQARDGQHFIDNISSLDLHDLSRLWNANSEQISRWQQQIDEGIHFESDLDFAGSSLVGGADADWLIDDTLIDCKVYGTLTVPRLRDFLRQVLGYVMLDLDDARKIRHVGIWLPRQGRMKTWSLSYLLDGDPEHLLPKLREGFIKATRGEQLGIYQPISQRRKDQLLADNLGTPTRMLDALANSEDKGLRFRVARNAATAERTVRALARDQYARVREGSAMNTRVPADVLEMLHNDKSVVVRRAAAANPNSLRSQAQALTSTKATPDTYMSERSAAKHWPKAADKGREIEQSNPVQIDDQREQWVLDSRWLLVFLHTILSGGNAANDRDLFPEASRIWASTTTRRLEIPQQLCEKLPEELLADLFRRDRPALVRRAIAAGLPIEDHTVRNTLLNDVDSEIRWSALQRSVDHLDRTMADLLGELAASRSRRIRFRTSDSDVTSRAQSYTPAELNDQTLKVIAAHLSTPPATLRALIETKVPEVLISLAQNPSLRREDRDALVTKMKSMRSEGTRRRFAESWSTPPEVLKQLARSRSLDQRIAVARNPSTPVDTLAQLSTDSDFAVRAGVLQNPKTPGELTTAIAENLLASSTDRELNEVLVSLKRREGIALPAEIIEEALDRLSKSRLRDPDMRRTATTDDSTSGKTLRRLANSTDDEIRKDVARHKRTPITVLSRLAQDRSSEVRRAVASNPITDQQTLHRLLSDDNKRVLKALLENPSLNPDDIPKLKTKLHRDSVKPQWTTAQLYEMAASDRAETRMHVAYSREATPDILEFLIGRRRNVRVRRIVAAHPRTSPGMLRVLADDDDIQVRQAVALNQSSPAELLAHVAGMSIDLALLVAMNPMVPPAVLDALAGDSETLVQFVATVVRADRELTDRKGHTSQPALEQKPESVEGE